MITITGKEGKRPLPEWTISAYVGDPEEDQDAYADITITRATQRAAIRFRPNTPEERPEEAREWELTTIHELLHVRFANLAYTAIDDIMSHLGGQAYQVAYAAFDNNLEQLIELMANVLHRTAENGNNSNQ